MVTYYEVKKLVCRIFGKEDIEINDDDVCITIKNKYLSKAGCNVVLKNDELKEIYDRVIEVTPNGLEMLTNNNDNKKNKYEMAISPQHSMMIERNFPIKSNCSNIGYEIGFFSIEYCIYLFILLIEKKHQRNEKISRLSHKFHGILSYCMNATEKEDVDWKIALTHGIDELSIKIISEKNDNDIEWFRTKKSSYIFEFALETENPLLEYVDLDELFPIIKLTKSKLAKNKIDIKTIKIIPKKEYINDVVDYYMLASSSVDPYIKFISFYHVMEYFYNELITPEFKSLKDVLKKYVNIEELTDTLKKLDSESVSYYQNNMVSFCKSPVLQWKDSQGICSQIARRIYSTRNALVHSKGGKDTERYKPYKDVTSLYKEIPLVRAIAEIIIIKSGKKA